MRLTPQNATITTATVEVKTLTIGSKQVTLAVYRQLQEQRMAGGGAIWGRVNHCPDSTCKQPARDRNLFGAWPDHCHIIWQHGSELRRTTVWRGAVNREIHRANPKGQFVQDGWSTLMAVTQLFIAA